MNGLAREFEIDRHCNKAAAHDAVIGRDVFGAVGGQDRDAVAALQAALGEGAGNAVRHRIELRERELPWSLLAAEIDDRDLGEVAITPDQIAEIGEGGHYGRIRSSPPPIAVGGKLQRGPSALCESLNVPALDSRLRGNERNKPICPK